MKIALKNCCLLDGTKDMKLKKNYTILIEDEQISSVSEDCSIPEDYKIMDMDSKYVMPGLINLHTHLPAGGNPAPMDPKKIMAIKNQMKNPLGNYIVKSITAAGAKTALMAGTTTVRAVGGLGNADSQVRDEINSGKRTGARILAANSAISVPGGHMAGTLSYIATTKEEAVAYVDEIAKDHPDLIKLMVTGGVLDAEDEGEPGILRMNPEMIKAASDRAHALGFRVAAHVESPEGVRVSLENGVDTIEHGALTNESLVSLYKEKHAALICTISPLIPMVIASQEKSGLSDLYLRNGKIVMEGIVEGAKTALANDIPVGLGTDTGCPYVTHYDMWRELEYFCKYVGVSPEFALYTATLRNAEIAEIDKETGSIEAGKSADILICEKNPLEDFAALRQPYMVIFRGKVYKEPKIKKKASYEEFLDSLR